MTTVENPKIPFTGIIPGGMYPGRIISLKCGILPAANRFAINFLCGSRDIAFHFNPRFDQNYIVRNSCIEGSWGAEETSGGMPLVKGEAFEAAIKCFHDCFKVSLNGKHFCDFAFRVPYSKITHFNVEGDVMVQRIAYEGPAPPPEIAMVIRLLRRDA
ncbi:hypothetical protein HW555_009380 [Spodoptera exigua]|uniref:Galectin n=1 Tax=Spodoptera exigua TaxID=7107 RepID=A0A835L1W2_SPOEX|nr:hypothetical protein HW555_009380 [Spodoptera exigua]